MASYELVKSTGTDYRLGCRLLERKYATKLETCVCVCVCVCERERKKVFHPLLHPHQQQVNNRESSEYVTLGFFLKGIFQVFFFLTI